MNVNFNNWSYFSSPYYNQSSRTSSSSSQTSGNLSISGDTLNLSDSFRQQLAMAVSNGSGVYDNQGKQQSGMGGMGMPPPPPGQSQMDPAQMMQREENLQNAYDALSDLDPENMTAEEMKEALSNVKDILQTGQDTSTESAEDIVANAAAGFDFSALENLDSMDEDALRETLVQLKADVTDKYERMQEMSTSGAEAGMSGMPGMGGPGGPGGPPPGGPPPGVSEENLSNAYDLVSSLDTDSMSDDEVKTALEQIMETLGLSSSSESDSTDESSSVSGTDSTSGTSSTSSASDAQSQYWEQLSEDQLKEFLNEMKERITRDYERMLDAQENSDSSQESGYGLGGFANQGNWFGTEDGADERSYMPQVNISGISPELFKALWNTYGQNQQSSSSDYSGMSQLL